MRIELYVNSSDNNVIAPSLTSLGSIDGHLRGSCNVLSPIINFKYAEMLKNANYMYIPEFGRYYHIVNKTYDGNEIIVNGNVDVLKTYATDIKNSFATVTRTNKGSLYIPDARISNTAQHNIQVRKLGSGLPLATRYVLTVSSKGE